MNCNVDQLVDVEIICDQLLLAFKIKFLLKMHSCNMIISCQMHIQAKLFGISWLSRLSGRGVTLIFIMYKLLYGVGWGRR